MFYNTHNNHMQFGFGPNLFNFDESAGPYWVKFGKAEYVPTSFKDECIRAARLISENAKLPIMVFFSGGMDSEIVVRSFQAAGIPVEIKVMRLVYRNEIVNQHDINYAIDYLTKNNLSYTHVDVDIESYILNDAKRLAEESKSTNIIVNLHNRLIEHFSQNWHCVFGGGDIKLKRHRFSVNKGIPGRPGLFLGESVISNLTLKELIPQNKGVSNRFLMHTPELMLAFLLHPDMQHWIKYEISLASNFTAITAHGIKAFVYHKVWPDLTPRPKFDGFEKTFLYDTTIDVSNEIKRILYDISLIEESMHIIDYEDLMNMLLPS